MSRPNLGSLPALAWDDLEGRYDSLLARALSREQVTAWLEEWSSLRRLVWERWSVVKSAEGWDQRDQEAQRSLSSPPLSPTSRPSFAHSSGPSPLPSTQVRHLGTPRACHF